jgi:hypothetical protein
MTILKCSPDIARVLGMRFVGIVGHHVLPADHNHMAVVTSVGWFHWQIMLDGAHPSVTDRHW